MGTVSFLFFCLFTILKRVHFDQNKETHTESHKSNLVFEIYLIHMICDVILFLYFCKASFFALPCVLGAAFHFIDRLLGALRPGFRLPGKSLLPGTPRFGHIPSASAHTHCIRLVVLGL
jgi:hypothetical protein